MLRGIWKHQSLNRLASYSRPLLIARTGSYSAAKLITQQFVRGVHGTRIVRASIPGFDMNNPTLKKIQNNPRVMAAMIGAIQMLQQKGFIDQTNPKPPSFMTLMQMMKDNEIKAKFMEMQKIMKEEGVEFSSSDLTSFMNASGLGGNANKSDGFKTQEPPQAIDQESAASDKEGEKSGYIKRFMGSFKSRS